MKKIGFRGRFWSFLIVISVIIILLVIGVIYFVNQGDGNLREPGVLDPKEVISNYDDYLGKNITVEGYFYETDTADEFGYISSSPVPEPTEQGEFDEGELLLINHSSINEINLTDVKFYFYGVLNKANISDYPIDVVYLKVNMVKSV